MNIRQFYKLPITLLSRCINTSLSMPFHSFYGFFHSLCSNQHQNSHKHYFVSYGHIHLPAFDPDLPIRCTNLHLSTHAKPCCLQWCAVLRHQHLLVQMGLQVEWQSICERCHLLLSVLLLCALALT